MATNKIDKESYSEEELENPFNEEFDLDSVVNKGDELGDIDSNDEKSPEFLTDQDIEHLKNSGEEAKKAAELFQTVSDDDRGTIIKKVDAESLKGIENPFDKSYQKRKSQDSKKSNPINQKIVPFGTVMDPDEEITYRDELKNQFKDYLEAPRISGKEKKSYNKNHIPKEAIEADKKTLEISDDPNSYLESEDDEHTTSVEINRDDFGEIESIVVNCQCGEKTLIEFNYDDDSKELTEITNEEIHERPLREPEKEKTSNSKNNTENKESKGTESQANDKDTDDKSNTPPEYEEKSPPEQS